MSSAQMKRALAPLYSSILLSFLGIGMMIPIFTRLVLTSDMLLLSPAISMGKRLMILGFLLAAYPLGQTTGTPMWGSSAKSGRKKRLLMVSTALACVGYVAIAFSIYTLSLIWLFIALFFTGLAEGNTRLVMNAIADLTEGLHRERYYGYAYCTIALAFVAGPFITGVIASSAGAIWMGFVLPFWIVAALLLFLFLWIAMGKEEHHPRGGHIENEMCSAAPLHSRVHQESLVKWLYIGNFILYLALFGFLRAYPIYLVVEYELSLSLLSWMIGYTFLPAAISNLFFASPYAKWGNAKRLTLISSLAFAILIFIALFPYSIKGFWIVLFLANFAFGFALTFSTVTLSRLSLDAEAEGRALGVNQLLLIESESFSSILIGLAAALFIPFSLFITALLALLAAIIYIRK